MSGLEQFSLRGKRALVTGGSRGLGRAIALGLAEAGASVAAVSRSKLADADNLVHIAADVSDTVNISRLVDAAEEGLGGPIDLVVHGAGIQYRSPVEEFPAEELQRILDVNLIAPYLLSQEIGKRQLEAGATGSHLFVGSLTSRIGLPHVSAYAAAKSGLLGVVRSLSTEWASRGIRINAIGPGYFRTALTESLFQNPNDIERLSARIPAGRFGQPEELVGASIFLLSEASSYVTGQLLFIDGGWTAA